MKERRRPRGRVLMRADTIGGRQKGRRAEANSGWSRLGVRRPERPVSLQTTGRSHDSGFLTTLLASKSVVNS
jgi:hypothetical protein